MFRGHNRFLFFLYIYEAQAPARVVFRLRTTAFLFSLGRCVIHYANCLVFFVLPRLRTYVRTYDQVRQCATPDNRQLRVIADGASNDIVVASTCLCCCALEPIFLHPNVGPFVRTYDQVRKCATPDSRQLRVVADGASNLCYRIYMSILLCPRTHIFFTPT